MLVHKSIEGHAITPAGCEVLDVDARIAGCLALAPLEKGFLGRLFIVRLRYLCNLEPQNNDPNETQDEGGVAVDDVLGSDQLHGNLRHVNDMFNNERNLCFEECQGLVDSLDLVNPHGASCGLRLHKNETLWHTNSSEDQLSINQPKSRPRASPGEP